MPIPAEIQGKPRFSRRAFLRGSLGVTGGTVLAAAGLKTAGVLESAPTPAEAGGQTRIFIPLSLNRSRDIPPTPQATPTPEATPIPQRLTFEQFHASTELVDSETVNGVTTELRKTPKANFKDDFVDSLRGRVATKVAEFAALNNNSFRTAKIVISKDSDDLPQDQMVGQVATSVLINGSWVSYYIGKIGSKIITGTAVLYFSPTPELNLDYGNSAERIDRVVSSHLFALTKSGRSDADTGVLAGDTDTINLINSRPLVLTRS